jgi:ABC-type uncharacterized transport system fused permease/ATPase subunit
VVRQDKLYLAFLAVSCAGFTTLAARDFVALGTNDRRLAGTAIKEVSTMLELNKAAEKEKDKDGAGAGAEKPGSSKRRGRDLKRGGGSQKIGADFWKELSYLVKVACPTPHCRFAQLLAAQFSLLVMRTLLTVRANKVNTFYLTKAISSANWKFWVRWFFNFGGWMGSAVVVNSGLRYTETLIQIELRDALTRHAHKKYMAANNFYRTAVLRDGGLDNVDQRIVADVDAFSREAAFLYGHSFKPILEFTLSLTEAAKELGYSRPLALFGAQIFITTVLRQMSPSLGKMVAREQALEGGFRHTHARLIAHAEEVALLGGASREVGILDDGLKNMVVTQRWHALQRIRKSVADNVSKFQGLLVGSIFVHVPFMVRAAASEGERISTFRATEELMLRCGSAFTEVLLLGRNLDELAGYTFRLGQLFRVMDAGAEDERKEQLAAAKARLADFGKKTPQPPASGGGGRRISFDGVSVGAPEPGGGHRLLVRAVTMDVSEGDHLLITGPNGAGKTSLLRVLAGLWKPLEGTVSTPAPTRANGGKVMMWLPQRPYLLQGSLRDQVVYPDVPKARAGTFTRRGGRGRLRGSGGAAAGGPSAAGSSSSPPSSSSSSAGRRVENDAEAEEEDERIRRCLRMAGLGKFVDGDVPGVGLGTRHLEWNDVLSGGERQRVGFARLFYHAPPFAILDEATSAINPDEEGKLYEHVIAGGTTVVSIAHRLELRRFHKKELKLRGDGNGGWELHEQKQKDKWTQVARG